MERRENAWMGGGGGGGSGCSGSGGSGGAFGASAAPRTLFRKLLPHELAECVAEVCNVLVLEYCDRGSLASALRAGVFHSQLGGGAIGVDMGAVLDILLDVASALRYIHGMRLVRSWPQAACWGNLGRLASAPDDDGAPAQFATLFLRLALMLAARARMPRAAGARGRQGAGFLACFKPQTSRLYRAAFGPGGADVLCPH